MKKILVIFGVAISVYFLFVEQTFAATVGMTFPNGGECFTVGVKYQTIEVSFDTAHVALYLRTDGTQPGHLEDPIIKHPLGDTIFTSPGWTPDTDDITETGRMWVEGHSSSHEASGAWDDSDADFAVRASCAPPAAGGSSVAVFADPKVLGDIEIRNITSSTAEIFWTTDLPSYSKIEYATTSKTYTEETLVDPRSINNHSIILDGLAASTTYYFRAIWGRTLNKRIESNELSFITLPPPDTTPPGQVRNAFGFVGSSTALFSWRNPTDPDFLNVIIVRRDDRFAQTRKDEVQVFTSNEAYYRDAGLTGDTTYYYSLFSLDINKNISLPVTISLTTDSNLPEVPLPPDEIATTKPPRIGAPSSKAGERDIMLSWKNPDDPNFLGVQVVRNEEALPRSAFDGKIVFRDRRESFIDVGLEAGKRYFYSLFAFSWADRFSPAASIADETLAEATTMVSVIGTTTEEMLDAIQIQITAIQKKIAELVDIIETLMRKLGLKKKTHVVHIESERFFPETLTLFSGETVRWINDTQDFSWPASDIHDTHGAYPESGGCIDSLFDACRDLGLEEEYSFTFNQVGRWLYHDHLEPTKTGVIIVE